MSEKAKLHPIFNKLFNAIETKDGKPAFDDKSPLSDYGSMWEKLSVYVLPNGK